jgi:hypothetical protein
VSDAQRLRSETDELERKLRRLMREIEAGTQTDLRQISQQLRKLLRNEVEEIDRLARRLN